jgi:DNA-binding NtrC family response regulator
LARILIADDERAICDAFSELLVREGHTPLVAATGLDALELAERERPRLVFLDLKMPGLDGLEVLRRLNERQPDLPVVLMTAYGTVDTAMAAMRLKAFDYLGKPVELAQLRKVLARALHRPQDAAEPSVPAPLPGETLIGSSAAMQEIFKLMSLLTSNELTVLVSGESGAGKELVARGIHTHGARRGRPFVAVNCAAIPPTLIESELFGHEKGAFTDARDTRIGRFEAAADGTVFLDEISELPFTVQGKLLRVLQERSFERVGSVVARPLRARVIAATNRRLDAEVEAGRFREDLYHRINLVTLHIPPLRRRKDDIEALAAHFLQRANAELRKSLRGLEPASLSRLREHDWPGNVRELEHAIKRAALTARGPLLTVHDLELAPAQLEDGVRAEPLEALRAAVRDALRALAERGEDAPIFDAIVGLAERESVAEALRLTGGNQVAAARLIGLNRTTLRKKMGGGA